MKVINEITMYQFVILIFLFQMITKFLQNKTWKKTYPELNMQFNQ